MGYGTWSIFAGGESELGAGAGCGVGKEERGS